MYIATLTSCILMLSGLNFYSFPEKVDLPTTVMYSSLVMVSLMIYYFIILTVIMCSPKKWGWHRHNTNNEYSDLARGEVELVHGKPRLHMDDVWILVYGVGFSYFVINYVCTCRHLVSLEALMSGLCLLIGCELCLESIQVCNNKRIVYLFATCLTYIGIIVRNALDNYSDLVQPIMNSDWFFVGFGICLPFWSICLMAGIKINKKFTIGGIIDLCEFGLPFSCIVALLLFSCMYQLYFSNQDKTIIHTLQNDFLVTFFVSPIPLVLCIILIIEAVVKCHVIDVLISMQLASCVIQIAVNPESQSGLISTFMVFCGLITRLMIFTNLIQSKSPNVTNHPVTPMLPVDDLEDLQVDS